MSHTGNAALALSRHNGFFVHPVALGVVSQVYIISWNGSARLEFAVEIIGETIRNAGSKPAVIVPGQRAAVYGGHQVTVKAVCGRIAARLTGNIPVFCIVITGGPCRAVDISHHGTCQLPHHLVSIVKVVERLNKAE
jgi:hypothetical protein